MKLHRNFIVLAGIGALTALVGLSSAQYISLDGFTGPIVAHAKTNDVVVSVDFDEATLKDVVKWMKSQNLNFEVQGDVSDFSRRLTLHAHDITGQEALELIAKGLRIGVSKADKVYVFSLSPEASWVGAAPPRAGRINGLTVAPPMPPRWTTEQGQAFKKFSAAPPMALQLKGNSEAEKVAAEAQAMAEKAESAADRNDAQAAVAAAKEAAELAMKAAKLSRSGGQAFSFTMPPNMGQQFRSMNSDPKAMGDLKRMIEELRAQSKDGKITPEQEAHLKALEDKLQEMRGQGFMFGDGDKFKTFGFMNSDPKAMADLKRQIEELRTQSKEGQITPEQEAKLKALQDKMKAMQGQGFMFGDGDKFKTFGQMGGQFEKLKGQMFELKMNGMNMKEFIKSLTPEQKAKAKSQGFLRLKDLTPEQLKMLGNPKGHMSMEFKNDTDDIKIKSDDDQKDGEAGVSVSV